jgi:K+-sensing histidine kinase KdpD
MMSVTPSTPLERAVVHLNRRHAWVWGLSATLMITLGLTIMTTYLTQPATPEVSWLPDANSRITLAWALPALIVVLALYLLHQERKSRAVRSDLLRASLQDETLRAHLSELSSLFEAAVQVQIQPALDLLLDIMTQRLLDCLAADRAALILRESDGDGFVCRLASAAEDGNVTTSRLSSLEGMAHAAFHTREKLLVDAEKISSTFSSDLRPGERPSSAICVPISVDRRVVGALYVLRLEPRRSCTAWEAQMLGILAEHIGHTVEQVKEYNSLDRKLNSLDETNRRMAQLDRLKKGFLAVVNHEARTPVASILSYAEFLLEGEGDQDPEKRMSYTRVIHAQAKRLQEILDQEIELFCMVAKRDECRSVPSSLNEIVGQVLTSLEVLAKEHSIVLDAELGADVPLVLGDPQKLPRAVQFLIAGLIRIAPPGERIRLRTWRESTLAVGEDALLEVSFSGSNLRQESLPGAFDPSHATEDMTNHEFEAFAWGFHLVKDVIEMHGGRAWTTGTPDQAICILFSLPAWQGGQLDEDVTAAA